MAHEKASLSYAPPSREEAKRSKEDGGLAHPTLPSQYSTKDSKELYMRIWEWKGGI